MEVDPIEGPIIMKMAGFTDEDLLENVKFSKIKDIILFFQGKEDKGFLIQKLMSKSPPGDSINHLWNYTQLRQELENHQNKAEEIAAMLQDIGVDDTKEQISLEMTHNSALQETEQIKSQLSSYE